MTPTGERSFSTLVKVCLWGLAFTLGLSAPAMADEHTTAAIAQFESATLPSLQAMAPFIEKSAAERVAAFDDLSDRRKACAKAGSEAYPAQEKLAYAAAYDCQMMGYWLADRETSACRFLIWTNEAYANKWPDSKDVSKAFKAAKVRDMHDRLVKAMACEKRTPAYWAQKTLDAFYTLRADYNTALWAALDSESSYAILEPCLHADTLSADVSMVGDAASRGCYLLRTVARSEYARACDHLTAAIKSLESVSTRDPLAADAPALMAVFAQYDEAAGCNLGLKVEPPAETPAPSSNTTSPVFNQMREFRLQGEGYQGQATENIHLAEGWINNGDSAQVCSYYQTAVSFLRKADHAFYQAIQLIESSGYDRSSDDFHEWKIAFETRIKANTDAIEIFREEAAPYCEEAGKKFY